MPASEATPGAGKSGELGAREGSERTGRNKVGESTGGTEGSHHDQLRALLLADFPFDFPPFPPPFEEEDFPEVGLAEPLHPVGMCGGGSKHVAH